MEYTPAELRVFGISDALRGEPRRCDDPEYLKNYNYGLTAPRLDANPPKQAEQISLFGERKKTIWD